VPDACLVRPGRRSLSNYFKCALWLQQGIRFGIAVALLATIPTYMIYYAVQPMPHDLVHQQIIYDSIAMVIVGIAAAFVNK
jgi:hypothetical protein